MNQEKNNKKKQDKLYHFGKIIIEAKLDAKAKALLWFYAYVFNWSEKKPSFWTQRRICASVGLSQSTYHEKRKYLEELGWLKIKRRGFKLPSLVGIDVGRDDPDYENRSWAKWHPSNELYSHEKDLEEYLGGVSFSWDVQQDDSATEYIDPMSDSSNSEGELKDPLWD